MGTVSVTARLVDGGIEEFEFDDDDLAQLADLQAQGLTGKRLINAWISDDWARSAVIRRDQWDNRPGPANQSQTAVFVRNSTCRTLTVELMCSR